MKKQLLLGLSLLIISALACNLPTGEPSIPPTQTAPPPEPTPTQGVAPTLEPTPAPTSTPTVTPPDLTHHPLYWFGPLPPLPKYAGRPFIGSEDFMQLFEPDAAWQMAADRIQVFKLYGEWVDYHSGDRHLRQAIADLNRRGLAIAIETGPLDPEAGCGEGIEGFATIGSGLRMARAIQSAGGTLHFIALDEPYYYGHFYDGPNACRWSAEKVATEVDEFIQAVRTLFPDVIIGDVEPLSGPAGAEEYQEWLDLFHQINGYHLAFLHMDVDWSRPQWPEEVGALGEYGRQIGVPVGVIYNGNAFDPTDEAFLAATGERVKKLELVAGVQPDHVIFQSWNDKPDRVLPDTDPHTFTGFINRYFTDKAGLGYQREGAGANVALGKPVQFSSQFEDLTGDLAVDGDFGTLWNSGGDPQQWIEIDLGEPDTILEIRLTTSQYPSGRTVHQVLGKGPSGQFDLLTTFEGDTTDGQTLTFSPAEPIQDTQFIRVQTVESPSWVAWREIEVISAGEP